MKRKVISKKIDEAMEELTSFDVYLKELDCRSLDWSSPVHRSEKFWKENCFKFEGSSALPTLKGLISTFRLIYKIDIILTETNPLVLNIACWDVGEFIRYHPQGRM